MTMLARHTPQDAYRRVDFDARVQGCDGVALVRLCYEHLIGALGSALFAAERGDNAAKSEAMTRALSALTALQMGIAGDGDVAQALHTFYRAGKAAILDSVLAFDASRIAGVRDDFRDIAAAMAEAAPAG
jgi:flagellar protein FliS